VLGGANFSHVCDGSMLSTQRNKASNFTFSVSVEKKNANVLSND
jgi:hypothetical protein